MANKNHKSQSASAISLQKKPLINAFPETSVNAPALHARSVMILSIVLFITSFLLYANTLQNDYALDDIIVLSKNTFVLKGLNGIPEILVTPHLRGYMVAPNETYRPLSLVFFAIEYQFFGADPVVGHFVNVFCFGACVVLLFFFLDNLFERKKTMVAFIASLLFALHPIHTEVVNNIKSFDELLCFFFAFLSLNLFLKYARSGEKKWLMTGVICMLLSLLSKETTITFTLIVPLVFFFYKNENKRRSVNISIGTFLAAISFIVIRAMILKEYSNTEAGPSVFDNALAKAPDNLSSIATAILILGKYIQFMFVPYPLICDYSFNSIPFATFKDISVWLSMLVYCSLIITAVYRLSKFRKDPWAFGILFFLLTIALFSNIFFLLGSEMSERFTFFASEGFCLLVALSLEKWVMNSGADKNIIKGLLNNKVWIILIPVTIIFSYITLARNREWKDSYTLYSSDLAKQPNNAHLNWCVGNGLILERYDMEKDPAAKQEIMKQGIMYLKKSIEIAPGFAPAQVLMGNAYSTSQQFDSAVVHFKIALALNPKDVDVLNNLAGIYFMKHDYAGALEMSLKIVSINPAFMKGYSNAGLCSYNLGQYSQAITYLDKAISIDPAYGRSYETKAMTYKAINNLDSAMKYVALAQKTNPTFRL